MRSITMPGVEIRERDLSQYNPALAGTTSLVMGFADKGEDKLPLEFTSRNSWLTYYGIPTNEAERYFYYASMEAINQGGKLITAKVPYDNSSSDIYFKSVYDVATQTANAGTLSAITTEDSTLSASNIITINTAVESVATTALDDYRTGTVKPTSGTFDIIDITRQKLTKDASTEEKEVIGTFAVVTAATNGMAVQNILDSIDLTEFNSVSSLVTSAGSTVTSADTAIQFATSAISDTTLSQKVAELFPAVTYTDTGAIDREYIRQIQVTVVKMYVDSNYNNKINFEVAESFIGSLNSTALNPDTNESIFIDDIINNNSNYIEFYSNITGSNLASSTSTYHINNVANGVFGFTEAQASKVLSVATLTTSITSIFDKLNNIDEVEIDIVPDCGLSNIGSYLTALSATDSDSASAYDPTSTDASAWVLTDRDDTLGWRSTSSQLINFCQNTRKDCIAIIDGMRPLVATGSQKIVRPSAPDNTIDANILNKVKYTTGLNSSYGAGYMNWFKQLDEFTGTSFWCPPSIKAMGVYLYTDRNANYWDAPAGLNRGVIFTANDIAFNPNKKQGGSIYTKGWNFAINYPFDGIVLEGQKTLQTKPSAFDRVNVRRMFLRLERLVYQIARYYVYEPNNSYTRTRFVDQITPIFEDVKLRGGLYDYRIICDETNNTSEVIDRNELKVAIMLKPSKTSEFILVDFIALRTSGSFAEIVL